jgi:hypothetical protein
LPDPSPMADASYMSAAKHPPSDRVEAGKAPYPPDPRVGVDGGTVESAAVMKPEVLATVATARPMKERGGTVACAVKRQRCFVGEAGPSRKVAISGQILVAQGSAGLQRGPWSWAVRPSVLRKTRADWNSGSVGQTPAFAGFEVGALDRIVERVANDRRPTGVVEANAMITIRLDVAASTPSVPAVGAAPTEAVYPLVSTLVPARTVPAVAVPAIIIASEGVVLDSLDRLTESP